MQKNLYACVKKQPLRAQVLTHGRVVVVGSLSSVSVRLPLALGIKSGLPSSPP